MPGQVHPGRPERADRRRNRDLIVATARDAFTRADAAGTSVSMNEIARTAGVGIATLYRHFPTRDDLATAVYRSELDDLTDDVRHRSGSQDALSGIRIWIAEFATFALATRGLMDTLRAARQSPAPATSAAVARIADVVAGFLAAGVEDHSIRADADPDDVTVGVLALIGTTPPDGSGVRARRLLDVFIDGLAAPGRR